MIKTVAILASALVLSACATQIANSNAKQVIVYSEAMNIAFSQKLADAECTKQNKAAVLTIAASYFDRHYIFNCMN